MFAIIRNFMVSVRRTGTFLVYIYIYIYTYISIYIYIYKVTFRLLFHFFIF